MSEAIVAVADTHFHNWGEFAERDDVTGNSRLTDQLAAFQLAYNEARNLNAPLIIAGDIFHKRQAVDTRVYNEVYEVMQKNTDVEVRIIPGNHDKVTNSLYSPSSVDMFKYTPNVHVHNEMVTTPLTDNINVTYIPYGDEVAEINDFIKKEKLNKDKINVLVAHIGVEGSLTGNGNHRLDGAFTYKDLRPEDYDIIILGHYHKGQKLGGNPNHLYVGSLTQNNFGESDNTPGHVVFKVDGDEIETKKVKNHSKQFITIEGGNEPDNFEEILKTHYVRYHTDKAGAKALENTEADLSNVRVQAVEKATVETRIDIDNSTDPVTITKAYMKEFYPEAEKEALECLNEAL